MLEDTKTRFSIGDFKTLEEKKEKGEISIEEFNRLFTESRFHGLNNSIYPFSVGGSDAAIILGISKYKTPLELYMEKTRMMKVEEPSGDNKIILEMGHQYETPVRNLFSMVSGVKAYPCTKQFMNVKYKNLVANIDGLCEEDGELYLYEGKTTRFGSKVYQDFKEEIVPLQYYLQVQFYLEILELNYGYICCAWGLNPMTDFKYIKIKRDPIGKEICTLCQNFVDKASRGSIPTNDNVADVIKKIESTYKYKVLCCNEENKAITLPSEDFAGVFSTIELYNEELLKIKEQKENYYKEADDLAALSKTKKKEIESKFKAELKELSKTEKALEDDIYFLKEKVYKKLGNHKKAICDDQGVRYLFKVKDNGVSFNAKTKNHLKEHHMNIWQELKLFNPILPTLEVVKENR